MDAGAGESVSRNCEELVDKEDDGCDENYADKLAALTGVAGNLTAGDLCAKTCSEEEGEDGEEAAALAGHYHDPNHPAGDRYIKVHGVNVTVLGRDEPDGEVWHATGVITEPGKIDFDFS